MTQNEEYQNQILDAIKELQTEGFSLVLCRGEDETIIQYDLIHHKAINCRHSVVIFDQINLQVINQVLFLWIDMSNNKNA